MIYSMTGFARKELKAEWGTAVWEIRSVNQRYLETFYRIPENFRALEPSLRDRLRKKLNRGKVECGLRINFNESNVGELKLNEDLANQLIKAARWTQSAGADGLVNPADILRWPGVMATEEADMDSIQKELIDLFDATLQDFIASRASEGENMKALIEQRLNAIAEQANQVQAHMPEILEWQKDRIRTKFSEAKIELDDNRVEQEMILIAQKSDVAEELDRLHSHISETNKILKKGGAVGRRLDFMMQEFNREANTLGSKSINSQVTQSAVELKVLIEQMREQIQNIE
ncbi:YicC/YloC family endoribonuclease [Glaciecola petra]|uniref:YicC/YloC family endoribonuclease n=1 Tax=Glaciecola petra TaxID=3075602 RepID=A0ABU2ZR49_9ALTE|nr:YicC/YloC family endoribonuclease [Aestuariibacter sp. P117]MDT0595092.1 YicC/YloC family endoribonuclease [Aestuariibacter sp. P117]